MDSAPSGVLVRALVADGAVRVLVVDARLPAEHTRRIHGLGPDAARLGAESVVAAALSSAHIKGDEQLTLQIQGSTPRCSVYADVTASGDVRVRVTPADLHLGPSGAIEGILSAVKTLSPPDGATRELYRGITAIDGRLEEALGHHLAQSDQVDAVLRLGCQIGPDGVVRQAGGLLLERLPDEPGHPELPAERFVERYGWIAEADLAHLLTQIAFGQLGGEKLDVLESRAITWRCRCSTERIETTLAALGHAALEEMITEDHGAEVTCNFCGTVYQVSEERLLQLQSPAR
jgi:molecular chaperone Hsp33